MLNKARLGSSQDGTPVTDDYRKQTAIWKAKFFYDLTALNPDTSLKWVACKTSQLGADGVQYLMIDKSLRKSHVITELSPNSGGITIASGSQKAKNISVDGIAVTEDGYTVLGSARSQII